MGARSPRKPPARPDAAALREHALRYLARFAATETGLRRVLERRVDRWARAEGAAAEDVSALKGTARAVATSLTAAGLVDDGAYAAAKARGLARRGRSVPAVRAWLAARGAAPDAVAAALEGADDLLAAAGFARRRRLGPFGPPAPDAEARRAALAAFARAGFSAADARAALSMEREEAEALLRRG